MSSETSSLCCHQRDVNFAIDLVRHSIHLIWALIAQRVVVDNVGLGYYLTKYIATGSISFICDEVGWGYAFVHQLQDAKPYNQKKRYPIPHIDDLFNYLCFVVVF